MKTFNSRTMKQKESIVRGNFERSVDSSWVRRVELSKGVVDALTDRLMREREKHISLL